MDILEKWFKEALLFLPGEDLLIPVSTKEEGKQLLRDLLKFKGKMMKFNREEVFPLKISLPLQGKQYFVKIKREGLSPTVAFKTKEDGKVEKINIESSTEARIRMLMKKDGFTEDEIENYFSKGGKANGT